MGFTPIHRSSPGHETSSYPHLPTWSVVPSSCPTRPHWVFGIVQGPRALDPGTLVSSELFKRKCQGNSGYPCQLRKVAVAGQLQMLAPSNTPTREISNMFAAETVPVAYATGQESRLLVSLAYRLCKAYYTAGQYDRLPTSGLSRRSTSTCQAM